MVFCSTKKEVVVGSSDIYVYSDGGEIAKIVIEALKKRGVDPAIVPRNGGRDGVTVVAHKCHFNGLREIYIYLLPELEGFYRQAIERGLVKGAVL